MSKRESNWANWLWILYLVTYSYQMDLNTTKGGDNMIISYENCKINYYVIGILSFLFATLLKLCNVQDLSSIAVLSSTSINILALSVLLYSIIVRYRIIRVIKRIIKYIFSLVFNNNNAIVIMKKLECLTIETFKKYKSIFILNCVFRI